MNETINRNCWKFYTVDFDGISTDFLYKEEDNANLAREAALNINNLIVSDVEPHKLMLLDE